MSDHEHELTGETDATATLEAGQEPESETVETDEPDAGDEDDALEDPDEPDEEDAAAAAEAEREQERLAALEDDSPSIEKQKRDQDAKNKKLNQLAAHTAKRYADILGPDLDGFVGCVMCAPWFPGIRLPIMPEPETIAHIKLAIGEDPDPPLMDDPYSRQCDSCGGYGVTLTNSHVAGQKSAQCLDCHGRGWIAVGQERESNVVQIGNGAPLVAPTGFDAAPPAPLQTDHPRTPAEDELRSMGAIVVWPPKPPAPTAG